MRDVFDEQWFLDLMHQAGVDLLQATLKKQTPNEETEKKDEQFSAGE
jgi:hypothetical protein